MKKALCKEMFFSLLVHHTFRTFYDNNVKPIEEAVHAFRNFARMNAGVLHQSQRDRTSGLELTFLVVS